ncbi:gag protease polyprotein [Cucumis melo var. makuwa]|uniref:Gag protease polyprotein n=1 Tax=Cucumis melo var. makuwa TaxID=1194695 RepID=A0A5D3DQC3_CUCMM|nr:gag protease polyprotein [Cucumis melo var. makuwa]
MAKTILAIRQVRPMKFIWKCHQGEVHVGVVEEAKGGEQDVFNPEVQPVAQATDPAASVTHADLAAMEQRFRDLIMQMREQQQPAPPAPGPVPIVPQVVPDQLSAEAKHLRDFRKYNPTTFDGVFGGPHQGSAVVIFFGDHISIYEVP